MPKSLSISLIPNRPVITGENNECVFGQFVLIQAFHNLPDHIVDHHDKITVHTGIAFAGKFATGKPRCMWSRQRQIEKERLSGILGLLRRYIQKEECFICKLRQYLGMNKTRSNSSLSPECSLDFRPPITEIVTNRFCRWCNGVSVLDPVIWRDVERRRNAKKVVKASVYRATMQTF